MSLNIENFKSKLAGGGARPNLFRVIVNFPLYVGESSEAASFLCKAATIPDSTIEKIDVPFRGRTLPVPGNRVFQPWQITVYNGEDFKVHDAFLNWQDGINGIDTNLSNVPQELWYSDCVVQQLNRSNEVIKTFGIRAAWPGAVGAITLGYDNGTAIEEFTVDLHMLQWSRIGSSQARQFVPLSF